MNRIRIGRPGARSGRPWPAARSPGLPGPDIVRATGARADSTVRNAARHMMAWAGRRLWSAGRAVIRAVAMAHDGQVRMWECVWPGPGTGSGSSASSKAEIVELCQRGDRSVGQVARDFDLTETAVRERVRQAERDAGTRHDGGLTSFENDRDGKIRNVA
jgi:hypothetical protein